MLSDEKSRLDDGGRKTLSLSVSVFLADDASTVMRKKPFSKRKKQIRLLS